MPAVAIYGSERLYQCRNASLIVDRWRLCCDFRPPPKSTWRLWGPNHGKKLADRVEGWTWIVETCLWATIAEQKCPQLKRNVAMLIRCTCRSHACSQEAWWVGCDGRALPFDTAMAVCGVWSSSRCTLPQTSELVSLGPGDGVHSAAVSSNSCL